MAYTGGARGGGWLAVTVDGWWCAGMGACGARMLAGVCAVSVVLVRAVPVLCLVDGAQALWGPVPRGMSRGRFSRLGQE